MKQNNNKYTNNNIVLKILQNMRFILFILIVLVILYLIFNTFIIMTIDVLLINNYKNNEEGFTNPELGVFFGNCIYRTETNSNLKISKEKPYVDINLPNENKLTGFKVIHDKLDVDSLKFSLEIGTNNNNLKTVINSNNYNKFNFNTNIKDLSLFENEDGTPKYIGNKVRISIKNIDDYSNVLNNNDITLKVQLYGLDAYAPDYKEYSSNFTAKKKTDDEISDYDTTNDVLSLKNNENIKVIAITIPNNTSVTELLKVKYSNTYDNNTRKYVVRGPIQEGFDVSNNDIIYFNKPIIANKIYFNKNIATDATNATGKANIKVYLAPVGKRDEINFKLKTGVDDGKSKGLDVEGQKCPNIQQMIQKQLQAQQICEALEYKDRIKNSKVIYEKEKEYLKKLAQQEKELKNIENIINKIIERKNKRVSENQYYNVEQLDKELRKIEESRKKAETDLLEAKKAHDIKLDLQLDPQYTDILKKYKDIDLVN